jgi:hypothetical protein
MMLETSFCRSNGIGLRGLAAALVILKVEFRKTKSHKIGQQRLFFGGLGGYVAGVFMDPH